jgi:hypothetical protein
MRLLFAALLTGLTVAGAALAGPAAAAPVADFSVSPAEPRAGQAVSFFADPWGCDARPCVYRWTEAHADGTETVVGFGRVSTLAYDAPGAVSMVLTVTSRAFRAPPGPRSAADGRAQPPGLTLTAKDHRAAPGKGGWRPERGCYTDAGSMHTEVPDARVVLDVEPRDHAAPCLRAVVTPACPMKLSTSRSRAVCVEAALGRRIGSLPACSVRGSRPRGVCPRPVSGARSGAERRSRTTVSDETVAGPRAARQEGAILGDPPDRRPLPEPTGLEVTVEQH